MTRAKLRERAAALDDERQDASAVMSPSPVVV